MEFRKLLCSGGRRRCDTDHVHVRKGEGLEIEVTLKERVFLIEVVARSGKKKALGLMLDKSRERRRLENGFFFRHRIKRKNNRKCYPNDKSSPTSSLFFWQKNSDPGKPVVSLIIQ